MPGPGGGARGGGGGRGGSFGGGGFGGGRGGGFGGGFRPRGYYGGFGFWPRRYYGGGGCLGGLMGMLLMPILLVVIAVAFIISSFGMAFGDIASGGSVTYKEEVMQDYADSQYAQIFSGSSAYEDNLLLVVLVDEDYYTFQYIAWLGDHIAGDIHMMFGNNQTELGRAMSTYIGTNYKYSLDSNLALTVEHMQKRIEAKGLESSFRCTEAHTGVESRMYNNTSLSLTASTVDDALKAFTESTGIPIAIVIEYSENVFGRQIALRSIMTALVAVVLIIVAVVMFVKRYKQSKGKQNNSGNEYNNNYNNNRYQR